MMDCIICDSVIRFRWTDTHGIGACITCGAPYRIYHYEGDPPKRVEGPPKLSILEKWIPLTKRYWKENHRNCDPGAFNFPGSSYEVASSEDFKVHGEWFKERESEWPICDEHDNAPQWTITETPNDAE